MEGTEVAARLPDISSAAHDDESEQTTSWWQGLSQDQGGEPEQQGCQSESIAEQLRRGQPQAISELAEDAEGAKADCRADDECHAHGTLIGRGRTHPVIV